MSEHPRQRQEGGKRTDWAAAKRPADKPLITIITSTFNALRDLPWTASSLRAQTYPHVQWIVADGASTDGTVEWLSRHDELIDVWFSESDSGIYDAWNKAVAYAQGDWIQFIGAGDELAAPDTLSALAPNLVSAHPSHDLVYGKLQFLSETKRTALEEVGEPWENIKGRRQLYLPMLPMHPAIFAHKSLFQGGAPFDTRYRIAADVLFLTRAIEQKDPLFIDRLIDLMPLGGVSGSIDSIIDTSREYADIAKRLGLQNSRRHILKERSKLLTKALLLRLLSKKHLHVLADRYRKILGGPARWSVE